MLLQGADFLLILLKEFFPLLILWCKKSFFSFFFWSHLAKERLNFVLSLEEKEKRRIDKACYLKGKLFSTSRSKLTANHVVQTITSAQTDY